MLLKLLDSSKKIFFYFKSLHRAHLTHKIPCNQPEHSICSSIIAGVVYRNFYLESMSSEQEKATDLALGLRTGAWVLADSWPLNNSTSSLEFKVWEWNHCPFSKINMNADLKWCPELTWDMLSLNLIRAVFFQRNKLLFVQIRNWIHFIFQNRLCQVSSI